MSQYDASLASLASSMVKYRFLIYQMAKRQVIGRYRGSALGLLWSFFSPLVMLILYGFVFSVIFEVRWSQETGHKGEFAVILFTGLILHGVLAEMLMQAPALISGQPNFVKKVVFPLEILVPVQLLASMFHLLVSFVVLAAAVMVIYGHMSWTVLLVPIVVFPLFCLLLGIGWILASLGVFLRDIPHFMTICVTLALFVSPILFPIDRFPDWLQGLVYLNPLSVIVEQLRNVMLWGRLPSWDVLGLYTFIAIVICWLGYGWFQKTRRGFADVL